jgi:DeoR/GlpR family transcriptional regulator of sugar metabolism
MKASERWEKIISHINARGFASVADLSEALKVSDMTIRRDLSKLHEQKKLQKTFGGAVAIHTSSVEEISNEINQSGLRLEEFDCLITTTGGANYGQFANELLARLDIPIIAESVPTIHCKTLVSPDDYQAAFELGNWAGEYAKRNWDGKVRLLTLTYHLPNLNNRCKGFMDGLTATIPSTVEVATLNPQSQLDKAQQLTMDTLVIYPQTNIIFCANDTMALGALAACKELSLDPDRIMVLSFGVEGNSILSNLMDKTGFIKAGLAAFPELVGAACIDAALRAIYGEELPQKINTPHHLLTSQNLTDYYSVKSNGFELVEKEPDHNQRISFATNEKDHPIIIGVLVWFQDHEWYQNLLKAAIIRANEFNVELKVIDFAQRIQDEIELRQQEIARAAAQTVNDGETIILDGGSIGSYLAADLLSMTSLTVITNSLPIFETLSQNPGMHLFLVGGQFNFEYQTLVGPKAENTFREFRADKLFLSGVNVSISFGLSHNDELEASVRKPMLAAARKIILLADLTRFEKDNLHHIADLCQVDMIITNDTMPASMKKNLEDCGVIVREGLV